MKLPLTHKRIMAIAAENAPHVCDTGSPGGTLHNQRTIASAIRFALNEERRNYKRKKK